MATHQEVVMVTKKSSTVQATTGKTERKAAGDDLPKPAPQDEDNLPKRCPQDAVHSASSTEQLPQAEMVIGNDRLKNKALALSPCDEDSTVEDVIASSASSAANQAPVKQGPDSAEDKTPGLDIPTSRQEAASAPTFHLLPPSVDSSEDPSKSGFEQPQGGFGFATSNTGVVSSEYAGDCRYGRMEDLDLLTTKDAVMASDTVEPADSVAQKQPDLPTGVHPSDEINAAGLQGASSQATQKEPASPSDHQLVDGVIAVGASPLAASQRGRAQHLYDNYLQDEQQAIRILGEGQEAERRQEYALDVAVHDRERRVIDLRATRREREASKWATSCLACREQSPEVFIWPCLHHLLCGRCYMDENFFGVSSCPVCTKPAERLKFSDDMLKFISIRSVR